jgi:hypothetical protein
LVQDEVTKAPYNRIHAIDPIVRESNHRNLLPEFLANCYHIGVRLRVTRAGQNRPAGSALRQEAAISRNPEE